MAKVSQTSLWLGSPVVDREWLVGGAALCLLLLAEFVGLDTWIRTSGERLINPVLLVTQQVVAKVVWPIGHLQSLVTAQRRIQDLEYRYAEASAQLGEMNVLKAENQALRQMLTASDITLEKRVISVPVVSYGKPLVAGGSEDGIELGAMVLIAQTLVGRITALSPHQAEVTLLSQAMSSPVLVRTESGAEGILKGDDKRVVVTEIPINVTLTEGERVVTQGQAGIAPNIFVGRVASVASQPESAVKTAVVEQLVSFYEATIVEIR